MLEQNSIPGNHCDYQARWSKPISLMAGIKAFKACLSLKILIYHGSKLKNKAK
jgi:hypothetical protein